MRMTDAVGYIEHCMEAARTQVQHGQWFAFEHPESSSAWQLPCVQAVMQMAGVLDVTFDQCMVGLVSGQVTKLTFPMKVQRTQH